MKKWTTLCLCLLAVFCLLLITPKASAATYGSLTYTVSNGKATVTYCNISATGAITIPDTLGGYPVTTIGDRAFYDCRRLTSITIPDSVTTIGDEAFYWCSKLNSITIPDSVTTIGDDAFSECSSLTSITIPDSVTTIGDDAFSYCRSLNSITIPDSVTTIGRYAFSCCSSLNSITIPDSVTTIGEHAFSGCSSLNSITIPDSVTTIGRYAFSGCSSLTSITITDPSAWCRISFGDDSANPLYYADTLNILDENGNFVTDVVLDETVTKIPYYAFNASNITSVTIPDSVTTIGKYAFRYCSSLTNITIGSSVTTIGDEAFSGCTSLNSITIGSSVTTIGEYAFYDCDSLTSITIPDSVTTIGWGAFYDCFSLNSITIGSSVTTIGDYAFSYCSSLNSITIPDSATTIGDEAFSGCSSLKTVYYTGTKAQWNKISIASGNTCLTNATIVHKHTFTDYVFNNNTTCTQDGTETRTCTACGEQETRPVTGTATGHRFTDYISNNDATCTQDGTETRTCTACGERETRTVTGTATGHRFTDYISNNDTTCTQDGTETRTCTACGEQETRPVTGTATGHRFTDYISNNDATCIGNGTKTATCEFCSQTDTVEDPNAVGEHVWNEGDYYPPTQKREGYTLFTCTLCGETKKVVDLPPAEIIAHPVSVAVDSGETVQFTVQTGGVVVSYKWQYRVYYKWFDTAMTGYNTDTLTVAATGARNGYDYRCIVTFADGTQLTSKPAELTVNTFINITDSPNDQFVALGDKGQFTAAATGEQLKYQWQYCRPGTTKWIDTAMEGAKKPTVYIETTTARDGYMYRCMFTDVAGKVSYSEPATMTVLSYKSHPQETFAAPTDTVQFTVQVNVEEGFTYQWEYSKNNGATWSATGLTGNKTATLTVPAKNKNGYQYRCVITGTQRSKLYSKSAVLHVGEELIIEDQSTDCTVQAGKNVFLTVEATNVYTYQWQYARPGTTKWIDTTMEGATTATLKVQATANRNGYQYRCILKGLDGTEIISDVITLTVK